MQNINDSILKALQDTISILRTELAHLQKTIDTLMLTIEKITTGLSNVQARLTALAKLFWYGVSPSSLNLIFSYLSNRTC